MMKIKIVVLIMLFAQLALIVMCATTLFGGFGPVTPVIKAVNAVLIGTNIVFGLVNVNNLLK